jgi:hypothetical protein
MWLETLVGNFNHDTRTCVSILTIHIGIISPVMSISTGCEQSLLYHSWCRDTRRSITERNGFNLFFGRRVAVDNFISVARRLLHLGNDFFVCVLHFWRLMLLSFLLSHDRRTVLLRHYSIGLFTSCRCFSSNRWCYLSITIWITFDNISDFLITKGME